MISYTMILLYFCLIFSDKLFNFVYSKPIIGENVWPTMSNEYPFIASIGLKKLNSPVERAHVCGGSLITMIHVLTAAHCTENLTLSQVDVIVGEEDLATARFRYEVDSWITYNDWAWILDKPTEYSENDIAILKLTVAVNRSGIRPVTLTPLNNQQLYGTHAVMLGWGGMNQGQNQNVLHKARVRILRPDECRKRIKLITNKKSYPTRKYLSDAADGPYALLACGDSGGPLLNENNVLLGVASAICPEQTQWKNVSQEILNRYKFNWHLSLNYYRDFIENETGLVTAPREILSFEVPLANEIQ